jgi:hypothetical protein
MFTRQGENQGDKGTLFECLLAMVAAATTAVIFSLMSGVNWRFGLVLMCAAAALAGGVLFTILKMRNLGRASLGRELTQATRPGASGDNARSAKSRYPVSRIEQERATEQPVDSDKGCFHHENHPESPCEDQGQLTSHLPGSTPFFEELNAVSQIRAHKKRKS